MCHGCYEPKDPEAPSKLATSITKALTLIKSLFTSNKAKKDNISFHDTGEDTHLFI